MSTYVGLDVSQKLTAICVIDEHGTRVWEGACSSEPADMARTLSEHAPGAALIGLETGPLAVWHWHSLRELGFPVICIHARHAHAAIAMQANKTDRNDAHAIAQIMRTGWYRCVELKSMEAHRIRVLLSARGRVVSMRTILYGQIRGLLKTFGVVLPAARGGRFRQVVKRALNEHPYLADAIGSLLRVWETLTIELRNHNRALARLARSSEVCGRLMTMPGVGMVSALAYRATIDQPERFRRSIDVGAYLGLTPRRYQSGEIDRSGHLSKCGDRMTRSLLYEAAHIALTRTKEPTRLTLWASELSRRVGPKKAKVALARRMAVVLHRMWMDGTDFNDARSRTA